MCRYARAAKAPEALLQTVRVERDGQAFDLTVFYGKIDASADSGRALGLFERYQWPDEDRITPIVFLGETHLSEADAIESRLAQPVAQGLAADEPISETDAVSDAPL